MLKRSALTLVLVCYLWCGPAAALAPEPPVAVTITLTSAFDASLNALLDGQQRLWTATDVLLVQGAPRIEVTPGEIVAALPRGTATMLPLTITNTGAEDLAVNLSASGESVSPLSISPTANYTMLLVTPRPDTGLEALRQVLNELNDIAYTVWDPARGAPTLDDLLVYDVVLVGNRHLWEASGIIPDTLGNALADYIDLGGKVIDTQLIHAASDIGLAGRYIAEGYAPITGATGYVTGDFQVEIVDPAHPLMDQVTSMSTHASLNVAARAGAAMPAVYAGTGIPYVAANADVVSINQQLFADDWGAGDLSQLLYNAVLWLCGERVPWVSIEPSSVSIAPGGSFEATVTLDSANAHAPAVYAGKIYLESNDPVDAHLIVPVEMAALADLATGRMAGVIRSNRTGAPLTGVQVQVQASGSDARLRITDERGAYSFWLTPATYAVAVSATGYVTAQADVAVTPQAWVTHDVTLVRDAPWLRLDTTAQSATLPLGRTVTHTFELRNDGTQPLHITARLEDEALAAALPVGWATLDVDSLTIAPGEQAALRVLQDTAAFGGPRTARAAVRLTSDDPEAPETILTAEVQATVPVGYGLVSGWVTCARTGQPLAAEVALTQGATSELVHATEQDGRFGPWAAPAGDWTVAATSSGFVGDDTAVAVMAGEEVTASLALLPDAPWLRLTPARVVAVDDGAGPASLNVTVANDGSQPLNYALALDGLPAWVSIAPGGGLVAADAAEIVGVQLDTSAAPPGWTVIAVPLASNDLWQSPAALRLYVRRGQAMMLPTMRFR